MHKTLLFELYDGRLGTRGNAMPSLRDRKNNQGPGRSPPSSTRSPCYAILLQSNVTLFRFLRELRRLILLPTIHQTKPPQTAHTCKIGHLCHFEYHYKIRQIHCGYFHHHHYHARTHSATTHKALNATIHRHHATLTRGSYLNCFTAYTITGYEQPQKQCLT